MIGGIFITLIACSDWLSLSVRGEGTVRNIVINRRGESFLRSALTRLASRRFAARFLPLGGLFRKPLGPGYTDVNFEKKNYALSSSLEKPCKVEDFINNVLQ